MRKACLVWKSKVMDCGRQLVCITALADASLDATLGSLAEIIDMADIQSVHGKILPASEVGKLYYI